MAVKGKLKWAVAGEHIKVHLPGESPWAECVAVYPDGTWEGKLLNRTVSERSDSERLEIARAMFGEEVEKPMAVLHQIGEGDIVRFKRERLDEHEIWVPAEEATAH